MLFLNDWNEIMHKVIYLSCIYDVWFEMFKVVPVRWEWQVQRGLRVLQGPRAHLAQLDRLDHLDHRGGLDHKVDDFHLWDGTVCFATSPDWIEIQSGLETGHVYPPQSVSPLDLPLELQVLFCCTIDRCLLHFYNGTIEVIKLYFVFPS